VQVQREHQIVAGALGLSDSYRLAAYGAGQRWNDSGNDAPDFVWGDVTAPNTVTVTETNDSSRFATGWTDGASCPFTNRNVVLNRAYIGEDLGQAGSTAAHEFGHALGLRHDPFHDGDATYVLKPEDCPLVSLMFWRQDKYPVCGIDRPTTYDNNAINAAY
jgi:hypothetical protein